MERRFTVNGTVGEGYADDDQWQVGDDELTPLVTSLITELAEAHPDGPFALRLDLFLEEDAGFAPDGNLRVAPCGIQNQHLLLIRCGRLAECELWASKTREQND